MESTALRKIADFEKIYGGRPVGVAVFAMALRYLVGFVITGRGDLLHRAHYLLAENKVGASRPDLIFFRGILGRYLGGDEATKIDELLDEFKPFRNTMRQNQPEYYSLYLYFSCYYEILRNRERAAHKAIRALETYCETHPGELGDMLQALAYLDFGDFDTAHAYLSRAYGRGCHSPFLYLMLAKIYGDGNVERPALLMPFIKWAICQGFDADKILNRLQRSTERVLAADLPWAQRVYAAYPHDWILRMICLLRMGDGDLSETAYYYYKEAETRQLFFDGLIDFLIHAAHENGIEEVSRYSLELFLRNEVAVGMQPFVYHLLLTRADEKLAEYYKYDVLRFACSSLESKLTGRYYYSAYKFLLTQAKDGPLMDYAKMAEGHLREVLFAYDITVDDPLVKKIWIYEEERREGRSFDIKNGRLRVNIASGGFRIFCFDAAMRQIGRGAIRARRLLENASLPLLRRFFDKGMYNTEMAIELSRHYIESAELDDSCIPIFERTLEDWDISGLFKMRISVALGNYYAGKRDFRRAVNCYRDVNENFIDDSHIEPMLLAFIHGMEYNLAASLISKKSHLITDKNLYYATRRISASNRDFDSHLANAAYYLLLAGRYDRRLTDIVLTHYRGALADWIALYRALGAMSVNDAQLGHVILETAIKTRSRATAIQQIFRDLCENDPDEDVIADYCGYLAFEVLKNDFVPEYATIVCMEKTYLRRPSPPISYALAQLYIRQLTHTQHGDVILRQAMDNARAQNIILPMFKDIKDKNLLTTYIEKNSPIIHHSPPGKGVFLYYRNPGDEGYYTQEMKYVGFGIYAGHFVHFYGEEVEYYIEERMDSGSTQTHAQIITNTKPHMLENPADSYYTINNALIFEQMFKYEQVEDIITTRLAEGPTIRAKFM